MRIRKEDESRALAKLIRHMPRALWAAVIQIAKSATGPLGAGALTLLHELQKGLQEIPADKREEVVTAIRRDRFNSIENQLQGLGVDHERVRMVLAAALKAIGDLEEFRRNQEFDTAALLRAILCLRDVSRRDREEIRRYLRDLRGEIESGLRLMLDELPIRIVRAARDANEAQFEKGYLEEVGREYGHLELLGIGRLEQTLPIDPAFVSLGLSPAGAGEARPQEAYPVLAERDELVIVGPAGAGKSTLLQWEAVQCLKGERLDGGRLNPWHGCIPFFLRLRDLEAGEAFPPRSRWVSLCVPGWERVLDDHGEWISHVLEDGRALLILDGLDELPGDLRQGFWRELKKCVRGRDIIYRVSSRPFHRPGENDEQWAPPGRASLVQVMSLSQEKVDLLIDRWHGAAIEEENTATKRRELKGYAGELKRKLWRQPDYRPLSQLAQTPFLCAAICLIHRFSKDRLPACRRDFFRLLCEALLERDDKKIRSRRKPLTCPYDGLGLKVLVHMHAHLAFSMMMNPTEAGEAGDSTYRMEAEEHEVLEWLADAAKYIPNDELRKGAEADIRGLLAHLLERRNLLRQPARGWIDFHHRSLQEYLAASALGKNRWLRSLVRHAEDDRWRDTIVLAAGGYFAGEDFGNELIDGLLKRAKGKRSRPACSLAVACLDTAILPNPATRARALKSLDGFLPPRSVEEVKDVCAAGGEAVPLLAFERWKDADDDTKALCVLALMTIGSADALKSLGQGWTMPTIRKAMVQAPAGANALDLPPLVEAVMATGAVPEFALGHVRDLSPLTDLTELEALDLTDCANMADLAPVAGCTNLKSLTLEGCGRIEDLAPLRSLGALRALNLGDCGSVTDLTSLEGLTELESLDLSRCGKIKDLTPLAKLGGLRTLRLRCCCGIEDLSPLAGLTSLETLDLAYCTGASDLAPLEGLTALRILDLQGCPQAPRWKSLIKRLPGGAPGHDYIEHMAGPNLRMVWLEGGTFRMGSPEDEEGRFDNEGPVHEVTLRGFWMAATPLTQAQYEAVMGSNPSHFNGPDRPVETVSWGDAVELCRNVSEKTGARYTLPTEAQWEYACRAGMQGRFCFGDADGRLGAYAWYDRNSEGQTHPVGEKRANTWGLYDMHGNVWEWCQDGYGEYSRGCDSDPTGLTSGTSRVVRGGSWCLNPGGCRSAYRLFSPPGFRYFDIGFRLLRTP